MTTDLAPNEERALATTDDEAAAALAHVLGTGDLHQLTNEQRVGHYLALCRSLGINSLSRPFDWIEFEDYESRTKKLVLYPNKSCAEQLRRAHEISVRIVRKEPVGDLFVVELEGTTPSGRVGFASKYVSVIDRQGQRLRGQRLGNAYMKAESGALRRLTFSMVGLGGLPDPDELQRARMVVVDGTGAVVEQPSEQQRYLAEVPAAARAIGEPTYEATAEASGASPPVPETSSQAARPEEVARPARPDGPRVPTEATPQGYPASVGAPRPTFKPTKAQVDGWLRRWFAVVDGSSLDSDDARGRFVEQWTAGYVPGLRTDSLRAFFSHATARQAEDVLAHVEALVDDERRANEDALAEARGDAATDDPTEGERPF